MAMFLAVILSVSSFLSEGWPAAEVYAGQDDTSMEDVEEEWLMPQGGLQEVRVIEISEEEAASMEVLEEEEIADIGEEGVSSFVYGSQKYNSSWDIYSSNYIYNQLNAREKKFWNGLDKVCRMYLTGNRDVTHKFSTSDIYGNIYVDYGMEPGIPYGSLGLSVNRALELRAMFVYSNPQYYFMDSAAIYGSGVLYPVIYNNFVKSSARKSRTAKMKKAIDKMEKKIAKGKTDLEKAKIAHDLIIKNVRYDHYVNTTLQRTPYHQSAYSAFCEGYTVCAGYTKAFELLMNGAGVDAIGVAGSGHAWNMVCLNDSWYLVDCTWDDMDGAYGQELKYRYFGRSTAAMNRLAPNSHKLESYYKKYVPKCTRDSGATDTDIGSFKKPSSTVSKPKITTKKVSGGIKVTLKSTTSGAKIYYTLDGKNPSSSFTRSYVYRKPFKVSSNVTVKAIAVHDKKWDSKVSSAKVYGKIYKVKFNTMGGSQVSFKKVYAHTKLKKPANPRRSGYRFVGWYRDKNYKTRWDFGQKVKKNMTLYAKWKRK